MINMTIYRGDHKWKNKIKTLKLYNEQFSYYNNLFHQTNENININKNNIKKLENKEFLTVIQKKKLQNYKNHYYNDINYKRFLIKKLNNFK